MRRYGDNMKFRKTNIYKNKNKNKPITAQADANVIC